MGQRDEFAASLLIVRQTASATGDWPYGVTTAVLLQADVQAAMNIHSGWRHGRPTA